MLKRYLTTAAAVFLLLVGVLVGIQQSQANTTSNTLSDVTISGRALSDGGDIMVYDYTPTINGNTDSVATVTVTLTRQNKPSEKVQTQVTANANGVFNYTVSSNLAKATYLLSLTSRDSSDNIATYTGIIRIKQSHPNGTMIKQADDPTVYLLEGGLKRPIPSPTAFLSRNYDWDDIAVISEDEVNWYDDGDLLLIRNGALVKATTHATVFLIQNNTRKAFTSASIFLDRGYSWESIYEIPLAELDTYTRGDDIDSAEAQHYPGTPVKLSNDATVYEIQLSGSTRVLSGIPTAAVYLSHGFRWEDVVVISQTEFDSYTMTTDLTFRSGSLLKPSNSATVYIIEDGTKRAFVSGESFLGLGYAWGNIQVVAASELSSISNGDDIL